MMDGVNSFPPQAVKVRVVQEYEVYLYFQQGIIADTIEEKDAIIEDEALQAAFNEDGLIAKNHEDSDSSNGYIGFVNTFDPTIDIVYTIPDMPLIIKSALTEKGLLK